MIDLLDDPNAGIVMRDTFIKHPSPRQVLCHGPISTSLGTSEFGGGGRRAGGKGDAAGARGKVLKDGFIPDIR